MERQSCKVADALEIGNFIVAEIFYRYQDAEIQGALWAMAKMNPERAYIKDGVKRLYRSSRASKQKNAGLAGGSYSQKKDEWDMK